MISRAHPRRLLPSLVGFALATVTQCDKPKEKTADVPTSVAVRAEDLKKVSQGTDFTQAWRDLPTEGNACLYLSPRLLKTVSDAVVANVPAATGSGTDAAFFGKVTEWVKPLISRGQALVLSNQPDGILTSGNLSIPAGTSSLTMISSVSVLAGLALPAFAKVQEKAQETKEMRNLRQVAIALKVFAADHGGKYPAQLSELLKDEVIVDSALLEFTDATSKQRQPWLYNSALTDSSSGNLPLLASPVTSKSGKRILGFNDGSVRFVTEAEFRSAWGK